MTLFIDDEFKLHLENEPGFIAIETDVFDGKCRAYIEGYRFVPEGYTWVREDGEEFPGEMICGWRTDVELEELQEQYDEGVSSQDETIAGLMDDIEDLCNELIGE